MKFIDKNYDLIKDGLIARYSNESEKETSSFYLTPQQIDGIMMYLRKTDDDIDVRKYIVETIIVGHGFDEQGRPIEDPEQEDEEETETLIQ